MSPIAKHILWLMRASRHCTNCACDTPTARCYYDGMSYAYWYAATKLAKAHFGRHLHGMRTLKYRMSR